jgi:2-amino-4-hydroxy-6-hydroxymethyldihydropteridine diphosphokinase
MADIYISLGSNMGDRAANLAMARHRLAHNEWVTFLQCSPIVESSPWGPVEQPWYLNQVCYARTSFTPSAIMRWLRTIEFQGGRDRSQEERWGPRVIDIDLLAYDSEVYKDNLVEIPHPRLHERNFVLQPWAMIAPEWKHPTLNTSISELARTVQDSGEVRWWQGN